MFVSLCGGGFLGWIDPCYDGVGCLGIRVLRWAMEIFPFLGGWSRVGEIGVAVEWERSLLWRVEVGGLGLCGVVVGCVGLVMGGFPLCLPIVVVWLDLPCCGVGWSCGGWISGLWGDGVFLWTS